MNKTKRCSICVLGVLTERIGHAWCPNPACGYSPRVTDPVEILCPDGVKRTWERTERDRLWWWAQGR